MSKIEDMIAETKLYEILKKRDQDKVKKTVLCILAVIGVVAAVAGIAYAVYRFLSPNCLEDFEEDLDDDFEEDFEEDFFEEDEDI